jgi:hypothetical protein
MSGFPTPFGTDDGDLFDDYDEFVPNHIPTPGQFLDGHHILTGEDHVEFHKLTKEVFEERTVYDMTFNYNLARLNLDTRHEDAGYRYAEQADDPSVLRAEFTPTTPFCPQTHTLTIGSFRAWNGLDDHHEYELIRVRADQMHHQSNQINDQLETIGKEYMDTGDVPQATERQEEVGSSPIERARKDGSSQGPQSPF